MFFFILTVLNPLSVGTALFCIWLTAESLLMVVNSFSFKRYQVDEDGYFLKVLRASLLLMRINSI